jgi:hypothetical protein
MWIEIFRTGLHSDSSGTSTNYQLDDLQNIAKNYNDTISNSENLLAPLVKGHPKDDAPAHGWIEKLAIRGDILLAKIKELSGEMASQIKNGMYKKVSISLNKDNSLRHVGLLGAASPAVKGLENVKLYSENEINNNIENSEDNKIDSLDSILTYTEFENPIPEQFSNLSLENQKLKDKLREMEESEFQRKNKELVYSLFNQSIVFDQNSCKKTEELLNKLSTVYDYNQNTDTSKEIYHELIAILNNTNKSYLSKEYTFPSFNNQNSYDLQKWENADPEREQMHQRILNIISNDAKISYEEAALKAIL